MSRRSLVDMGFAKREVNLAVIARKLGISISTVSRALREASSIHPTTRKRVIETARALGYLDSYRTVGTKKARNVLVLSQVQQSDFDSGYMVGLSQAAISLNVSLISHHFMPENCHSVLDPKSQPMALKAGEACGVVLLHHWPEEVVHKLSMHMPVVSIIHFYPGVDFIGIEERKGMYDLVAHLVSQGRSRIGFFGFCPLMSLTRSRFSAYVEALTAHGLPFRSQDIIEVTLEEATELIDPLPSGEKARALTAEGVTAWICSTHMLEHSLIQTLQKRGFKIPSDVSLSGFHGNMQHPFLTTICTNLEELGTAALKRLISRIENPQESCRSILFPCNLLPKESTNG